MSLKERIRNALKWKKNSEYCSEKLGITEEEFDKVKKEVQAEGREKRKEEREMGYATEDCTSSFDVENGQGKITGISQTEPKSPEEIIKEVKDLVLNGVKEITLIGQNVNAYSSFNRNENLFRLL